MTLRYGVIGCGMMGLEHIRNIALLDDVTVTAIADPNEDMREQAAQEIRRLFGREPEIFEDHQALIASNMADVLVLVSPNHTHAPILLDCLKTDLPILAEKPFTTTVEDAFRLNQMCAARVAPLWVGMEYRYMPPVARLIEAVHAGSAGKLVRLSIQEHRFPFLPKVGDWNRFNAQTGGTLIEKCCHFFDLMRLITGSEPVSVQGSGAADVNHRDETYGGQVPDILDNAFIIVDFENGIRGALDLCMFAEGSYFQEEIRAIGDVAKIEANIPGPARLWADGEKREAVFVRSDRAGKKVSREVVGVDAKLLQAGDHFGSTFYEHKHFQTMVQSGGKPEVSALDGALAVLMGASAERACRDGVVVSIEDEVKALKAAH